MNAPAVEPAPGEGRSPGRKLDQPGGLEGPLVEHVLPGEAVAPDGIHGPRWIVRSYEAARMLIRSERTTKQAGFGALTFIRPAEVSESARGDLRPEAKDRLRPPVLYLEGAAHRDRRRSSARFFTPKAVEAYRTMIEDQTRKQLAPIADGRRGDLSQMALAVSVAVVAQVVGLSSSLLPGKTRRIEATFTANLDDEGWAPFVLLRRLRTGGAVLAFFLIDVLPAIRSRRRHPAEDLISHLIATGFRPLEILTECVIYCAAGMATTREFITIVAWHLLENRELLERFRTGNHTEKSQILHEVLRLEPVVGHLYRQLTAPTSILVNGVATVLDDGTLVDLDIRAINADAALVGAEPLLLVPGRPLSSRGVAPSVLGFGDGSHRCPGGPLALLEAEIFLTRLLEVDPVVVQSPTVSWVDLTGGYELRRLFVRRAEAVTLPRDNPPRGEMAPNHTAC